MRFMIGILYDTDGSWYICDPNCKIIYTDFEQWVIGYPLINKKIKWYDSLDKLIEERRERLLIQQQQQHTQKIFSLKIQKEEEKSPHVMHYLKHPIKYTKALNDFINHSVSSSNRCNFFNS